MASKSGVREVVSSSSSSYWNHSRWNYDVFLSYRGEDTGQSFTDHLYAAMRQRSIVVFRDDVSLERGKAIAQELHRAIEESRQAVVVLSRNYASSSWCLDELVKIVECKNSKGQIVLPIFYDVDPSMVRNQTGSYQEAFHKHEEIFKTNIAKVDKWRDALTQVANLSGWHRQNQQESKFIQEVVEVILNKLRPLVPSTLEEGLVGMDSRLMQLSSCVDIEINDVRFVGICGMGGIGKTTVARSYYNQISYQFEGSTFLANVKEVSARHGLVALQDQLLCQILKKEIGKIWDVFNGTEVIKKELCKRRVLIIIDDVDHPNQLKFLAGKEDWFGAGSRIIVTTRDESLLYSNGVEDDKIFIYKPDELRNDEAVQLFSLKAFKTSPPPEDYVNLSSDVVKYAGGLPLALEVMGSFLSRKAIKEWRSALARMKANPEKQIFETLKISFDGLEENEKNIFLDIACFFKGKDQHYITEILDSCGFYPDIGIRTLVDKSLVTILENKTLWMHDLLQEMGRKIVRQESEKEPGKRSRIWLYEDVYRVFTKVTGTEAVEGIVLELPRPDEALLNAKTLSKMSNLRLLIFHNLHFAPGLGKLSDEFRVLKWHGYPFKSLPSSFHAEELTELEMCYSHVEQLWKGMQRFKKLKVINLSHSQNLIKTPNFRGVPNLEKLILEGCVQLREIDESIAVLECLNTLNLKDCRTLATLPSSIYGMKALTKINLSGCLNLDYLLEKFGNADCLDNLDISGTATRHPPSSLSSFKNLRLLSLRGHKLEQHQSWISHSFFGLYSLKGLDLSNCDLLENSVLSDLSSLSKLLSLNLSGNNFTTLPASVSRLPALEFLYVDDCKRLQSLQELPSNVKIVTARGCSSLNISSAMAQSGNLNNPESESTVFCDLMEYQDHSRMEFRMTRQYLLCFVVYLCDPLFPEYLSDEDMVTIQGLFNKGPPADIIHLGSEIPKWFNCRGLGNRIAIKVPPLWKNGKWLGFAVAAVFVMRDGFSNICNSHLQCNMVIRSHTSNQSEGLVSHTYLYENSSLLVKLDHFWLCYLPRQGFLNADWPDIGDTACIIEFNIIDLDDYFDVKECGVHLVFEGDGVEFDHGVRQFCRSNIEELKLVLYSNFFPYVPHGTVLKQSCDDWCISEEGESSGNGNFQEESVPLRLKELD